MPKSKGKKPRVRRRRIRTEYPTATLDVLDGVAFSKAAREVKRKQEAVKR